MKILSGKSLMSGDFAAPPTDILKSALQTRKNQLTIKPAGSIRFIALPCGRQRNRTSAPRNSPALVNFRSVRLRRFGWTE